MDGPIFNDEYLRRLADGDKATELHFTTYFSDHLRIKLRTRLRSAHAIEDVKQETFLRVFRQLRDSKIEKLGPFVNKVCDNVLFETYRSQVKHQGAVYDTPEQPDVSWQPDEALADEERRKKVRSMLDEMPERERRVLKALFLEEKDKDEVCREFGIDREYLRVMVHRAKNRARGILVKKSGAGE